MMVVDGLLVQTCIMVGIVGFVIGFGLATDVIKKGMESRRQKSMRMRLQEWKSNARDG